jgi:hypothetical protein
MFVGYAKSEERIVFNNIFLAYYTAGLLFFPTLMGLGGDLVTTDAIFACMCAVLVSGIVINAVRSKR